MNLFDSLFGSSSSPLTMPNQQSGSLVDSLLAGIFGRNEDGSVKKLDLGNFVSLPPVTVQADKSQSTILIVVLAVIAFFIFKKKR